MMADDWPVEGGEDNEALVPHSHAVLGLKVADAEEAGTVKKVGGVVLGLMVLLGFHFIVHVAHRGHVLHAVMHLLTAAVLPAAGYIAVSQRSTKAAWGFHLMTVISSVVHALLLIVVVLHVMEIQSDEGGSVCARFAKPCEGIAARTGLMKFSPDRSAWRCQGGLCIDATRHCDGEPNCFDRSDELGCIDAAALSAVHSYPAPTAPPLVKSSPDMERCDAFHAAQARAPRLKWWWFFMSLPMWGLCLFAAYHSLEFYVQLRVRRLSARVDRVTADATVFDRADADRVADVAE